MQKKISQMFQSAGGELCCSLVCCSFCNLSVLVLLFYFYLLLFRS